MSCCLCGFTTLKLSQHLCWSSFKLLVSQNFKLQELVCDITSIIANMLIGFKLCPAAVCVYFGSVNDVVCCSMYVPCL